MAWNSVPTYAVGDPWTAAAVNTYIRDNLNYLVSSGGSLQPAGTDHYFGPNAAGGTGAKLHVNADTAQSVALNAEASGANSNMLLTTKGTGGFSFNNSGVLVFAVSATGKVSWPTAGNTATTVGAAGAAAALPANPVGYEIVTINGTDRKVPYYNT